MAKRSARVLEDSDILWLQQRYRKLSEKNPEMTITDFALDHGVDPRLLKTEEFKARAVILWHGTTRDRAAVILREGFVAKQYKHRSARQTRIWFTTERSYANQMAQWRARLRGQEPIVIRCRIDLIDYPEYTRPRPSHYVFERAQIGPEVILHPRSLKEADGEAPTTQAAQTPSPRRDLPDVCVTRQTGPAGLAFWLNTYYRLEALEAFSPDSPVVLGLEAHVIQRLGTDADLLQPEEMAELVDAFLDEDG